MSEQWPDEHGARQIHDLRYVALRLTSYQSLLARLLEAEKDRTVAVRALSDTMAERDQWRERAERLRVELEDVYYQFLQDVEPTRRDWRGRMAADVRAALAAEKEAT